MQIIDNRREFTDFIALEQHNRIYSGSLLVVVSFISVILHLLINSLHLFDQLMWPQNMAFVFISCSRCFCEIFILLQLSVVGCCHPSIKMSRDTKNKPNNLLVFIIFIAKTSSRIQWISCVY